MISRGLTADSLRKGSGIEMKRTARMISERENYLQRIEDLRSQVGKLISGLRVAALNWRPLETSEDAALNSLAVLTAHIAGAEHFWVSEGIGRRPATRNRQAEFAVTAADPGELASLLERTGVETREVFSRLDDAELDRERTIEGRHVPVRWGLLHVIDHTALHLGHMQLTYQLWMGGPSFASPMWFERLPGTV